ncbi:MAG: hypothetical protein R2828_35455 [Saprospiraceae bacterium]
MKDFPLCLLILLLGYASPVAASTYQVIKVKGHIVNKRTGEQLITKSQFSSEDELTFLSDEDRLALIDEHKRSFIARPKNNEKGYSLQPIRSKLGTRPGKILSYIEFVEYLNGRDFLILGGQATLEINATDLQPDETHFFYIRYRLEGEAEPVNKKLPFQGNRVILSKQDLFTVDAQSVSPAKASNFQLFFYDSEQKKSLKINDLRLVFPDEEGLTAEIEVIRSSFKASENQEGALKKAIENYLIEVYGVPEKGNLDRWLRKHQI